MARAFSDTSRRPRARQRGLGQLRFSATRLTAQNVILWQANRAPLAASTTTPAQMVTLLRGQQDHRIIARRLPPGWTYAGKAGGNPDPRADVGLVGTPDGRHYALTLYVRHPRDDDWSVNSPGTLALAWLAQHLLDP